MFRYRLRTLLLLAIPGRPALAVGYWAWKEWTKPSAWDGMLIPDESYGFKGPNDARFK